MKQQEILEGNTLIAEFMGLQIISAKEIKGKVDDELILNDVSIPETMLYYYSSWDWLMPVVEKINDTGVAGGMLYDLREALTRVDIDLAWKEVIKFIKWHNEWNRA